MTRSAPTAGSTRCRRRCCWPSCPHLADWSAARARNAARYTDGLRRQPADCPPPATDPANEHIYNQYTLRVPRRDALLAHLQDARHRELDLLPAGAAPAALLRPSGVPRGQPAGHRGGDPRGDFAPGLSRADPAAAGRGHRRGPRVLRLSETECRSSRRSDQEGRAAREALFGIIGLGYVGLPLAVELASAGYRVLGFDVQPAGRRRPERRPLARQGHQRRAAAGAP